MYLLSLVSVLAFAFSVSIAHNNSFADLDGSVWERPQNVYSRANLDNRLSKRQSSWSPPANLVTPLQQVWDHEVATYSDALGFQNYGYDQLMANKGYINYCVRWESTTPVTEAQRDQIASVIQAQHDKWMTWLFGFSGFPYTSVPVKVVGWGVSDASILQGATSGVDVYTGFTVENAPHCNPACGRFFNQNNDYSKCPGGAAQHFDFSLWLTDGFNGGAGGDWGQRIGREYFMSNLNTPNIHILLHEMGHTYALDDFYDWTPSGVTNFIMKAGSATEITAFDGWMMRDWWRHLASRYGL